MLNSELYSLELISYIFTTFILNNTPKLMLNSSFFCVELSKQSNQSQSLEACPHSFPAALQQLSASTMVCGMESKACCVRWSLREGDD